MATNKRLIKSNDEGGVVPPSFNTVLYTGNQSTQAITGVGFQPDFIWIKERTSTSSHAIFDSVRGINKVLASNTTEAEDADNPNLLTSFNSDGFSLGDNNRTNQGSIDMVSWNFKAGGAAVATGNTNLSNSFVSANPESGFSVMTYTGSGTDGTINHGLNKAPEFWIYKNRTNAKDWFTCTTVIDGSTKYGYLNTTAAFGSGAAQYTTDTLIAVNADGGTQLVNGNGNNYVLYAFHSVAGFSKFGSYTGTGVARTIPLDFTPAFVMIKRTGTTGSWQIFDNKRSTYRLLPNYDFAESQTAGTNDEVTLVPNGFTLPTDLGNGNNSALAGNTYIYMAFANQF